MIITPTQILQILAVSDKNLLRLRQDLAALTTAIPRLGEAIAPLEELSRVFQDLKEEQFGRKLIHTIKLVKWLEKTLRFKTELISGPVFVGEAAVSREEIAEILVEKGFRLGKLGILGDNNSVVSIKVSPRDRKFRRIEIRVKP